MRARLETVARAALPWLVAVAIGLVVGQAAGSAVQWAGAPRAVIASADCLDVVRAVVGDAIARTRPLDGRTLTTAAPIPQWAGRPPRKDDAP